jgi:transposase-like protein
MGRPKKYPDEFRRRAVDEVLDRGRKIPEVAVQLGITSPETLRRWVRQAEADPGSETGADQRGAGRDQEAAQRGGRPAAHHRDLIRPGIRGGSIPWKCDSAWDPWRLYTLEVRMEHGNYTPVTEAVSA